MKKVMIRSLVLGMALSLTLLATGCGNTAASSAAAESSTAASVQSEAPEVSVAPAASEQEETAASAVEETSAVEAEEPQEDGFTMYYPEKHGRDLRREACIWIRCPRRSFACPMRPCRSWFAAT